jgi:hypothetical protein
LKQGDAMITITIDEYVNGFGVRVHEKYDGYAINEFHEEKIDALKAVNTYINTELIKDLKRRQQNAL